MADRASQDYIRSAERRLLNAGDLYRQASGRRYDDAYLELSDVGMLIWSAGIDVISALMVAVGDTDLGTSTNRRQFLRRLLKQQYPLVDKPLDVVGWSYLVRMHNFQHNLDLPEPQFVDACNYGARYFGILNSLLPTTLRLPEDAYAWLLNVR